MKSTERIIVKGRIKRLNVDRRVLSSNRRDDVCNAALRIITSNGTHKARRIEIHGPATFVQSDIPMACGTRCWIETRAAVTYEI